MTRQRTLRVSMLFLFGLAQYDHLHPNAVAEAPAPWPPRPPARTWTAVRRMAWLFGCLLMLTPVVAQAQPWAELLSPPRTTDWSSPGVAGGIPKRTTLCATLNPGASVSQINSAIAACPSGQVVFLSAGTYTLSSGITFDGKSNVTLRGAGADQTFLKFSDGSTSCAGLPSTICILYPVSIRR